MDDIYTVDAATTEEVFAEVVVPAEEHLLLSTPFNDYTVTEGLLLLIFLAFLISSVFNLVRRCI